MNVCILSDERGETRNLVEYLCNYYLRRERLVKVKKPIIDVMLLDSSSTYLRTSTFTINLIRPMINYFLID